MAISYNTVEATSEEATRSADRHSPEAARLAVNIRATASALIRAGRRPRAVALIYQLSDLHAEAARLERNPILKSRHEAAAETARAYADQ